MSRRLTALLTSPALWVNILLPVILGAAAYLFFTRESSEPRYGSTVERNLTWECSREVESFVRRNSLNSDLRDSKRRFDTCYCFAHKVHTSLSWMQLASLGSPEAAKDPEIPATMRAALEACHIPVEIFFR